MLATAPADTAASLWMALPFVLLLGMIAAGPLAFHRWWERFYPHVSVGLGAITASYYLMVLRQPAPLLHVAEEYFSFIALIGSLYVIAGGIHIRVKGEGTPLANCVFLLIGAIAANFIGTTGASMLLIRPWIRVNRYRVTTHHVVFFIFIVSNVGGCLTPIGDPPLFLGFLKGVPFWWVIQHCWEAWLIVMGWLLGIFYVMDRRNFLRAPKEIRDRETQREEWHFGGLRNLLFLAIALGGVFLPLGWREAALVAAALASWFSTPKKVHRDNAFNFHPIAEVAWLFIGIFCTMLPALQWLEANAAGLGLHSPSQFFWLTGSLSGVLDNAPTYLAFLAAAFGLVGMDFDERSQVTDFASRHPDLLMAISLGSVFFGAMTYLGNGPNLMVKAIATSQRAGPPGFVGYIVRYALPILVPVFLLISLLFFSRWRVF